MTIDVSSAASELDALLEPEVMADWSDEMIGAAGLVLVLARRAQNEGNTR